MSVGCANESTSLVGSAIHSNAPSVADHGTFSNQPEDESSSSSSLKDGGGFDRSIYLEAAQTELSFEEMRGSMLEGCCPGDSIASGALSLLTTAVTPTMLSLPLAFTVGGIQFALIGIACCVAMTLVSVRILAFASASAQSDDYETVAGFFLGEKFRWLTRTVMFFYNFGCSVVYLRFIYDSITPVLAVMAPKLPPWLTGSSGPVFALCLFVLAVTPLSFNKRLASLRTKGLVSNVLVTFIVVAVVYRYMYPIHPSSHPGELRAAQDTGSTATTAASSATSVRPSLSLWEALLPYFFAGPIFVFAYEVQSNVMGVFRDLSDPRPSRILLCVCLALAGATLFYVPIGLFGAWSFPLSQSGNVLSNYDLQDDMLMLTAQLCCCCSAAVAFVFVLFPSRFAFFMFISDGSSQKVPHRLRIRIGILLSAVSCFLALFVPDVAVAVAILGACCSATLSMTLPALFCIKMRQSGTYCTSFWDGVSAYVMLAMGLLFSIVGTAIGLLLG